MAYLWFRLCWQSTSFAATPEWLSTAPEAGDAVVAANDSLNTGTSAKISSHAVSLVARVGGGDLSDLMIDSAR